MTSVELTAPRGIGCWLRLGLLYRRAFPREERKPFWFIYKAHRSGKNRVWCIRQGGKLRGLASCIPGEELVLLDYLAVEPGFRGKGLGAAALEELKKQYPRLFVEIESIWTENPSEEALRRREFYLRSGMEPMDVLAEVFGVPMELLGWQCRLSFRDYRRFYHDYNSPWAAEHLRDLSQK